jgi:hypothetical protein
MRALAKQPAERFPSARALCDALEGAAKVRDRSTDISGLEETVLALAPARASSPPRWLRFLKVSIVLSAALLLVGEHWPVSHEAVHATRPVASLEPVKSTLPSVPRAATESPKRSQDASPPLSKRVKSRRR